LILPVATGQDSGVRSFYSGVRGFWRTFVSGPNIEPKEPVKQIQLPHVILLQQFLHEQDFPAFKDAEIFQSVKNVRLAEGE